MKKLLTISEAAKILGVTSQAIDYKVREGKLELFHAPRFNGAGRVAGGGRRMVSAATVRALALKRGK